MIKIILLSYATHLQGYILLFGRKVADIILLFIHKSKDRYLTISSFNQSPYGISKGTEDVSVETGSQSCAAKGQTCPYKESKGDVFHTFLVKLFLTKVKL